MDIDKDKDGVLENCLTVDACSRDNEISRCGGPDGMFP